MVYGMCKISFFLGGGGIVGITISEGIVQGVDVTDIQHMKTHRERK